VNVKVYQCYGIKGYEYTHKEKLRLKKYSHLRDRKNIHTDRCGNTSGQECHTKEGIKESKIQEFMYGDTTNVEHEMHGDISDK
jgi:hypothetical protein